MNILGVRKHRYRSPSGSFTQLDEPVILINLDYLDRPGVVCRRRTLIGGWTARRRLFCPKCTYGSWPIEDTASGKDYVCAQCTATFYHVGAYLYF